LGLVYCITSISYGQKGRIPQLKYKYERYLWVVQVVPREEMLNRHLDMCPKEVIRHGSKDLGIRCSSNITYNGGKKILQCPLGREYLYKLW
jgi:hypothetical protein